VIVNVDKSSQFLPCLKKVDYLYFTLTMAEFFTVTFRRDLWRKLEIKLPPPLKSVATLPCKNECLTTQLCSAVNSVQSDTKTCNYGNCSLGMIFLCLNWLLCHVYFECLPGAKYACFDSCIINYALFNAVPNVYLQFFI